MSAKEVIGVRLVVASISGGKDSAAMSLHLKELGIEHRRVFADTGWEADDTYAYLRDVLPSKIGPIEWVKPPLGMAELAAKKGMFPGRTRRYCTQDLKVFPLRDAMQRMLDEGAPAIVNAVGIRAAESEARSKFTEWEPFPPGWPAEVETWRPLLRWTVDDVIAIHRRHGLPPNPLYLKGASRVGCWPCIFSRKAEIALIARVDPGRIERLRDLERAVGDAAEARQAARGTTLAAQGYERPTFFTQSARNEDGKRPCSPIDVVVAWASDGDAARRAAPKQLPMFDDAPDAEAEGCMRWGVCETSPAERSA